MDTEKNKNPNIPDIEQRLNEDYLYRIGNEVDELRKEISMMRIDRQLRSFPVWVARKIRRTLLNRLSDPIKNKIKIVLQRWSNLQSKISRHQTLNPSPKRGSTIYKKEDKSILLIAHRYPIEDGDYGGSPIARRVPFYKKSGYNISIFVPSNKRSKHDVIAKDGTPIFFAPLNQLEKIASRVNAGQLAIHSPTPEIYYAAKKIILDFFFIF